jgi:hypothetical protein
VQIRNHIVALWRYDVSQHLSLEAAAAQHDPEHQHLVAAAWNFLNREGYINWGIAPAITDRPVLQRQETVIIIGSGLAGVAHRLCAVLKTSSDKVLRTALYPCCSFCMLVCAVVWAGQSSSRRACRTALFRVHH